MVMVKIKKHNLIVGLDEAGRGAWAGPIVAGAVIIGTPPPDIKDSKKLSANRREKFFLLIEQKAISWSVGIVDHQTIDKIGIQAANMLAFERALNNLTVTPNKIFIDTFKISYGSIPVRAIIKGDEKNKRIAAASIVAKVTRDDIMRKLGKIHSNWDFQQHKGYGTAKHQRLIDRYGLSPIHRLSFYPMNSL